MRVGIVGAGFAGLSAAIAFRQNGHDVTVFEKASGPLAAGGAIALAPNALACLAILGVKDQILTQPWSGMAATVRTPDGRILVRRTLAQLTGGDEFAAVPRAQLIAWLTARLPSQCVQYGCSVTGVGAEGTVEVDSGTQRFDLVVGADGVRSVTRRLVFPDAPSPRSTGITGWAWIVDRELATGFGPIWGRTADFGILPLVDGRTYVYGSRSGHAVLDSYRTGPTPCRH
jgi:2-polyprenyl-6-methoxyphenol hydroxylase-like FAD-dependent oxidoreductase